MEMADLEKSPKKQLLRVSAALAAIPSGRVAQQIDNKNAK
jgi:hypothetical protein